MNSTEQLPTLVLIPCFSGAAWAENQQAALAPWPVRALTLAEGLDDVDAYADRVLAEVADLDRYVLVGDSFGAAVALACAVRRPRRLVGLVVSGGFASDPLTTLSSRFGSHSSKLLRGSLYRNITLWVHAWLLRSPHDIGAGAEVRWPVTASRQLFVDATPWSSYVARVAAARRMDLRDKLSNIAVPTLVLTPSYDHLVGRASTEVLTAGIDGATEIVLPDTGHMLRFSHPRTYGKAVNGFLTRAGIGSRPAAMDRRTSGDPLLDVVNT